TALPSRFMRSGRVTSPTVLVQREVAERLASRPGEEGYGYLSALVALHGRARVLREVPKGAFFPAPDVTSSIVRLDFGGEPPAPGLLRLLEGALHHRRKTLRNNLRLAGYSQEALDEALPAAGLDPSVRAEDVPLAAMRALYLRLGALGSDQERTEGGSIGNIAQE
ncbi:MAG: ribosomal RNA small subunit methyltransferase A, partial [Deinococcus sp.]